MMTCMLHGSCLLYVLCLHVLTPSQAVISEENTTSNAFVTRLASFFPDTAKAEECLHSLNQTEEVTLLDALGMLLEKHDLLEARVARVGSDISLSALFSRCNLLSKLTYLL